MLAVVAIVVMALVLVTIIGLLSEFFTPGYSSSRKDAFAWVPSLIAAGASLWVFYNQQKASAELELLKAELTRKLDDHRSALAEGLESIKGKLAAERKAYDQLHAAAILYYYTLAKLEVGKLTPELLTKADDSMLAASRYSAFVPKADRELWMQLWQTARAVGEQASSVVDPQQQARLWAARIKDLSTPMKGFANAVMDAHQRA